MGGAQQGGRAVAEVKKTASKEHPASAFPLSSLLFCVHVCVEACVYLENIFFFHFPAKSFTCALRQMCYSTLKVLLVFFLKNTNSLLAGSFTYKLTLSEIEGSTKFKLLYHS